jgi:uncharacterized protein
LRHRHLLIKILTAAWFVGLTPAILLLLSIGPWQAGAVFIAYLFLGHSLYRKHRAHRSALDFLTGKQLPKVVMLRPFKKDKTWVTPGYDLSSSWITLLGLKGAVRTRLRPWLRDLLVRLGRGMVPGLDFLLFTAIRPKTLDGLLANEIESRLGQLVVLGDPSDTLMRDGAIRLYVDDSNWKSTVTSLLATAHIILIQIGDTPGLRWELLHIRSNLSPHKVFFLLEPTCFGASEWTRLADLMTTAGWRLTNHDGSHGLVIGFDKDWNGFTIASNAQLPKDFVNPILLLRSDTERSSWSNRFPMSLRALQTDASSYTQKANTNCIRHPPAYNFLAGVYWWLFVSFGVAGVTAKMLDSPNLRYFVFRYFLALSITYYILIYLSVLWLAPKLSLRTAPAFLLLHAALQGAVLAYVFLIKGLGSIDNTFLTISAGYLGMACFARFKKTSTQGGRGLCVMILSGLIVVFLWSFFYSEPGISFLWSCIGLAIYACITGFNGTRLKRLSATLDGNNAQRLMIIAALLVCLDLYALGGLVLRASGTDLSDDA